MSTSLTSFNNFRNIGFISTRIAGTDGVSLEIEKWTEVLERNGYNCHFFAGELDRPETQSCLAKEAHFGHPDVIAINNDLFGKETRSPKTSTAIQKVKSSLKNRLYDFLEKFKIDLIIPENVLAIPMNIPLGIAITELIAETGIPLLEAGMIKLPIVCSDIPPFREIGNDNVCYFSLQETPETIAGKIIHFVENLRPHKMYQRVKNNYVWDNIYHKTLMPTLEKIMKC